MTKSERNKSICFRLNSKSSRDVEYLIEYLQNYQPSITANQKIAMAVDRLYLALAIPSEHKYYERIVLDTLNFYYAQINLLERVSGINLQHSDNDYARSQSEITPPYNNGRMRQTESPLRSDRWSTHLVYGNTQSMPKVSPDSIPTIPVPETSQIESSQTKTSLTEIVFTIRELEVKFNKIWQDIDNKILTKSLDIKRIVKELQPEDEEAWTEEMWDFYDQTSAKISEILISRDFAS